MFTIANTISLLFCLVLFGLVLNAGHVVTQKIELQNTADAVAYSGAVWQARGMNAITATNHVIGEVLAFVVLHHAFGGDNLDATRPVSSAKLDAANEALDLAYLAAQGTGVRTGPYQTVRQVEGICAEATLLHCKINLKKWLTLIYGLRVTAMKLPPPAIPAALAILSRVEDIIAKEYSTLKLIHNAAALLSGLKENVRDVLLPAMKDYTRFVRRNVPELAEQTAWTIAQLSAAEGTLFGSTVGENPFHEARLPLEIDPLGRAFTWDRDAQQRKRQYCDCPTERTDDMRKQIVKTTQLARATFPWVLYHRQPLLHALGPVAFLFAGQDPAALADPTAVITGGRGGLKWTWVADVYKEYTDGKCVQLCDRLQQSEVHDLRLYVVRGSSPPDKGYEDWTKDQVLADRQFTVIGLARYEPPLVMGIPFIYRQAHPQGRVTYAQAMIYNGNRQIRPDYRIDLTCKRIVPEFQAVVGWDTLNWWVETDDERVCELRGGGPLPAICPKIRVNWQAKLVPGTGTRLQELTHAVNLSTGFRETIATQLLDEGVPPTLRTH